MLWAQIFIAGSQSDYFRAVNSSQWQGLQFVIDVCNVFRCLRLIILNSAKGTEWRVLTVPQRRADWATAASTYRDSD
jgi:hypothetical protein